MTTRARQPLFELALDGENVAPATVKAGVLGELLIRLERAVETAAEPDGVTPGGSAVVVALRDIEAGSCRALIDIRPAGVAAFRRIVQAVRTRSFADVPYATHEALAELSRVAAERQYTLRFGDAANPAGQAVIDPQHPIRRPTCRLVHGESTVFGYCYRVGGLKHPRLTLRLPDNKTDLIVHLGPPLQPHARELLYQHLELGGRADWRSDTWAMVGFLAERFTVRKPVDAGAAFDQLRQVVGGAWDDVDPEAYVREQRGTDEGEGG